MQIIICAVGCLHQSAICFVCSICESIDRKMNGERRRRIYAFNRSAIVPIGRLMHGTPKREIGNFFNSLRTRSVWIFPKMGTKSSVFVFHCWQAESVIDDAFCLPSIHLLLSIARIVHETVCLPLYSARNRPTPIQLLINDYAIRIEMDSFTRRLLLSSSVRTRFIFIHLIWFSDSVGRTTTILLLAASHEGNRSAIIYLN